MKSIANHKIEYSIDYDQYWEGVGTSFTKWDQVYTGVGSTYREAYEDMIDQIAQCDYDVSGIPELEENADYDKDASEVLGIDPIGSADEPGDYNCGDFPRFYVSCCVKDGLYLKTCDQCQALRINGVWSHETGCPNIKKRFDYETGEWYSVFECFECGYELREGEACNCCDPVDCEE